MKRLLLFLAALPSFGATVSISTYGACTASNASSNIAEAFAAAVPGDTVLFDCVATLGSTVSLYRKSNITVTTANSGGFRATGIGNASNGVTGGILFDVRNCTNCLIRNLQIDGNDLCTAVIGATNNTNSTFDNLTIRNVSSTCGPSSAATAAIQASGNTRNTYSHLTLYRDTTTFPDPSVRVMRGMWLGNVNTGDWEVSPTVTANNVTYSAHSGIVVTATGHASITNNVSNHNGCAGIKVVMDGYNSPGSTATITDNTANLNDCHGLQITVNYGARNLTVSNNTFNQNTQTGIYIVNENPGGSTEVLRNSTFRNNIIHDNQSANLTGGMYFNNGAASVSLTGNSFVNTGLTSPHQIAGIVFGGAALLNGVTLSGNTFSGHTRDGVTFWNTPSQAVNVTFTNNTFTNNASYGLFGAGGSPFIGIHGSGNTFSGNGTAVSPNIDVSAGGSPPLSVIPAPLLW